MDFEIELGLIVNLFVELARALIEAGLPVAFEQQLRIVVKRGVLRFGKCGRQDAEGQAKRLRQQFHLKSRRRPSVVELVAILHRRCTRGDA